MNKIVFINSWREINYWLTRGKENNELYSIYKTSKIYYTTQHLSWFIFQKLVQFQRLCVLYVLYVCDRLDLQKIHFHRFFLRLYIPLLSISTSMGMYVCVYVCMCVCNECCVYACMYVCNECCVYVCMCVCNQKHTHVFTIHLKFEFFYVFSASKVFYLRFMSICICINMHVCM